jgi:hypothetical protein
MKLLAEGLPLYTVSVTPVVECPSRLAACDVCPLVRYFSMHTCAVLPHAVPCYAVLRYATLSRA